MGSGKAAAEPAAGALAASGLRPQHDASAVVQLLRGAANFTRVNTMSDRFDVRGFHSVEFWCSDATNTYKRFQHGLGMTLVGKSDLSTANSRYASYVLKSNDLKFVFTAPLSRKAWVYSPPTQCPLESFDNEYAHEFVASHGLAVRALGIEVGDAEQAYHVSVENGAVGVLPPVVLHDVYGTCVVAEVKLYGDVVLRYVSGDYTGPFLPKYELIDGPHLSYGLVRLDHAVGNVPCLLETVNYIMRFTGFHEFAEFTAEDVGTVDSGLNSMVLACNNEMVLLPVNEPTHGTPRKSQIQTYLEQNEGAGLQHLALKTNDIFATLRHMHAASASGGFEFMPRPSDKYYRELPKKIGDVLTPAQYQELETLGILADRDDQGVLLQIFTKPLGDRPTVFIEIIERVGCVKLIDGADSSHATRGARHRVVDAAAAAGAGLAAGQELPPAQGQPVDYAVDAISREVGGDTGGSGAGAGGAALPEGHWAAEAGAGRLVVEQAAGCGGFGKGNFGELFKRIEDYERTLSIQTDDFGSTRSVPSHDASAVVSRNASTVVSRDVPSAAQRGSIREVAEEGTV